MFIVQRLSAICIFNLELMWTHWGLRHRSHFCDGKFAIACSYQYYYYYYFPLDLFTQRKMLMFVVLHCTNYKKKKFRLHFVCIENKKFIACSLHRVSTNSLCVQMHTMHIEYHFSFFVLLLSLVGCTSIRRCAMDRQYQFEVFLMQSFAYIGTQTL